MMRRCIVCLIYLVALMAMAVPQLPSSELVWKNVSVNGRKNAAFSIFKDSRGLMWIGSNHGLSVYDGVTTRPVGPDDFQGSQVYAIVEHHGHLYLGDNNGLYIYDFKTGQVTLDPNVTDKEIRTLMVTGNDLWIGGINGLTRYNLTTGETRDMSKGLPHKSVYSLIKDSRGITYAGTYLGPARLDEASSTFYPLLVGSEQPFLANCILESADHGSIYFGGEGTLLRYHLASNSWQRIAAVGNNNVKSLAHGDGSSIVIGSDNGVYIYNPDHDTVAHYIHDSRIDNSIADNEIWCLYCDSAHNLWAGHERGFSVASNSNIIRSVKLGAITNSGEGNDISLIHRDRGGDLWLAGSNGIILLGDKESSRWYRHSDAPGALSHKHIRAIYEDTDGTMWFATDGGIDRLDRAKGHFDVFHITDSAGGHNSNWVYALGERGEYLWCGGFLSGVHFVDKQRMQGAQIKADISLNEDNGLSNDLVNSVVIDRNGDMWILLFRSRYINRYNPTTGQLTKIDMLELTGDYPVSIAVDNAGAIWCAHSGGVTRLGDQPVTARFPEKEEITAMAPVGDKMWVSTQTNVWEIDGEKVHILPLPQKTYTAIYDDTASGNVILGSVDELLVIDKDAFALKPDFRTVKMVSTLTGPVENVESIDIPSGGSISLLVSTLDYTPDNVDRYMYRLGNNSSWVILPEGVNTISLTDLGMGHYTLYVKTVDSTDGGIAIPVHVAAPWFLSWWAVVIYLLVLVGVIWMIAVQQRRRSEKEFIEKERQAVLENTEKKLTFLSTISHDLKTPLSMILGPVSLLKERVSDPDMRHDLETVYDNAVRLNNMIHRTLELQHIEAVDENLLILSTFNVVEFCRSIFEVFKENNPQKEFIFFTAVESEMIEADAVKLESVVTNLLSNACKYSHDGATISLGINSQGGQIEIVVSDDGMGISEGDQSLVFHRMFRAPATAKLKEGTGLGLYLIKKYLELMHGDIALYSKEGEGTTFVVTLPVSENAAPLKQTQAADDGKSKVLIVEDNVQLSGFISSILSKDYSCITAENGKAGLAIAATVIPDLIVVDEMMPIMSGLEMVRRMKQNPRLAAIPVIMLTAKTDNQTENESIKLGIDVFMGKPFEPLALTGRVAQLLKSRAELKEKVRINAIAEAESKPIEAESLSEKQLAKIAKIIEENISDTDLNVNMLCDKSGIPNKQLYRLIKKYMDTSPVEYIRNVRLQKAAVLLSQHRFTVSEVSYMVGFNTPSYFAKCFQQKYGTKPSEYQGE